MSASTPDDVSPTTPYRTAQYVCPVAPTAPWRVLSLVSFGLSALAVLVTLTSFQLTSSLVGMVRMQSVQRSVVDLRRRAPPPPALVQGVPPLPLPVEVARPLMDGIRPVGRDVYVVSRGAIEAAINSPAALMRRTTISPETRDGRVVGVRVFGIQPGDMLDSLGFENGDVLRAVNGFDVASPDRCLEAYTRLRSTDRIELSFERRGRLRSHIYAIVSGV